MSAAAIINPPIRLTSVKNALRCSVLRCGSGSAQNMCAPALPGMTVHASTADAIRGSLPLASKTPPPICASALALANASTLDGTFAAISSGNCLSPSNAGRAASPACCGRRSASTP